MVISLHLPLPLLQNTYCPVTVWAYFVLYWKNKINIYIRHSLMTGSINLKYTQKCVLPLQLFWSHLRLNVINKMVILIVTVPHVHSSTHPLHNYMPYGICFFVSRLMYGYYRLKIIKLTWDRMSCVINTHLGLSGRLDSLHLIMLCYCQWRDCNCEYIMWYLTGNGKITFAMHLLTVTMYRQVYLIGNNSTGCNLKKLRDVRR